jgi:hypothetical protein
VLDCTVRGKPHREERLRSGSVAAMTVWDGLKPVIARLLDQQPGALASYPLPDFDLFGPPPIKIRLEPWDLAWFAATFGDLADPDVMSRAWQ